MTEPLLNWTPLPPDKRHDPAEVSKWRGKRIGGKHPRIEIRKSVLYDEPDPSAHGGIRYWRAQILAVVDGASVQLSANGTMKWSRKEWEALHRAVREAQVALDAPPSLL